MAVGVLGGDGEMAKHLLPEAQGEIAWAEQPGGKREEEEGGVRLGERGSGHDAGRMLWAMCR